MTFPHTRRDESIVDELHGHQIADPYRWLEDPDSQETRAWVSAQNEATQAYLDSLPDRAWFNQTLRQIVMQPRASLPHRRGPLWFMSRNDGSQAQAVWFVAQTLDELIAGGRQILDPNQWSEDGTASLSTFTVSPDGALLAYAMSVGGSDWQNIVVIDVATGKTVDEAVVTKFSSPEWMPDSRSFTYARYAEVGEADGTQTDALPPADLAVHRVGTPVAEDETIWRNPGTSMLFTWSEISQDERWMIVTQGWGTERETAMWAHRLHTAGEGDERRTTWGERIDVVAERTSALSMVRVDGDTLIAHTDLDAPKGRVVAIELGSQEPWREIVAEGEPIADVRAAADGLLVERMVDVLPQFTRVALDGTIVGSVNVEGTATIAVDAKAGEDEIVLELGSPAERSVVTVASFATGETRRLPLIEQDQPPMPLAIDRRYATSADGTQVPYWLISAEGTDLSSPLPTLVYGYGGFSVSIQPFFSPGFAAWLQAGGLIAIGTLRGGGEFGRAWYDGGRRENKQHVFDDVIAIGEHLVATGTSTPAQLAIHGRSNGGLLAGAAEVQRPDLWACALPGVGVLDLLRFHKFTGGLAWASDYGNPDVAEDFEIALAYSPLHNIKPGVAYPATLVTTGDHDDRVVPLHSHKFTATLQHAQGGEAPILTRIETSTGHGAGKPMHMIAEEWADLLAFAAHHTGLHPHD